MFPVGDDDSDRGGAIPFVTWGLIALNVLAFLLEINRPSEAALQSFIQAARERYIPRLSFEPLKMSLQRRTRFERSSA